MLKIITALTPESEQQLLPDILAAGHQVLARAADAGELLQRMEEQPAELIVLHPNLQKLSAAVLQLLDGFGARILMLVADDDEAEIAESLGVSEHYSAELSWQQLAEASGLLGGPTAAESGPLTQPVLQPVVGVGMTQSMSWPSLPATEPGPPLRQRTDEAQVVTPAPMASQLIAAWGPQGAPGRSTVALNLAKELAAQGQQVILVDADSYGGSLAAQLGLVEESSTLAKLCRMAALNQLDETTFAPLKNQNQIGERLFLLSGIVNPKRWPELAATRIREVIELCRASADAVVVDIGFNLESDEEISSDIVGPRRNAAALTVLEAANRVVAVSGSSSVALGRFLRGIQRLTELVDAPAVLPVLNRAPEAKTARNEVLEVLARFGALTPVAVIPDAPMLFAEAERYGYAVSELKPKHEASVAFGQLARALEYSGAML